MCMGWGGEGVVFSIDCAPSQHNHILMLKTLNKNERFTLIMYRTNMVPLRAELVLWPKKGFYETFSCGTRCGSFTTRFPTEKNMFGFFYKHIITL